LDDKLVRWLEGKGLGAYAEVFSANDVDLEALRYLDDERREAAKAVAEAGVDEEGAVRAALARIVAFQADPEIFEDFMQRQQGDLDAAWQDFQHASGSDELLELAGELGRKDEIQKALNAAKPEKGWSDPEHLDNYFRETQEAMENLDAWGDTKPQGPPRSDEATRRTGPKRDAPKEYDSWGFEKSARTVRDRWLRSAVRRTACSTGKPSRGRP